MVLEISGRYIPIGTVATEENIVKTYCTIEYKATLSMLMVTLIINLSTLLFAWFVSACSSNATHIGTDDLKIVRSKKRSEKTGLYPCLQYIREMMNTTEDNTKSKIAISMAYWETLITTIKNTVLIATWINDTNFEKAYSCCAKRYPLMFWVRYFMTRCPNNSSKILFE